MFGLHVTGFVLLQHDNCYYSGRGLPWATGYKLIFHGCEVVKGVMPVVCQIMARLAAVACAETSSHSRGLAGLAILGLGLILRLWQYGRPS